MTEYQKNIQDQLSELFNRLVPDSGSCETVAGEIVRACNRIIYRRFNDGDMVGSGYGNITVNPACRYLKEQCARFHVRCEIFDMLPNSYNRTYARDITYDDILFQDMEKIIKILDSHPELFDEVNDEDMLDYLESIDEEEERADWANDDYDDEEY